MLLLKHERPLMQPWPPDSEYTAQHAAMKQIEDLRWVWCVCCWWWPSVKLDCQQTEGRPVIRFSSQRARTNPPDADDKSVTTNSSYIRDVRVWDVCHLFSKQEEIFIKCSSVNQTEVLEDSSGLLHFSLEYAKKSISHHASESWCLNVLNYNQTNWPFHNQGWSRYFLRRFGLHRSRPTSSLPGVSKLFIWAKPVEMKGLVGHKNVNLTQQRTIFWRKD